MIGTFIYNSSGPNNPSNNNRRNSGNCNKKQVNISENYNKYQINDIRNQRNQNNEVCIGKMPKLMSNIQSSGSLENDISDFSQYAAGVVSTDSSLNSCSSHISYNKNMQSNSSKQDSIESICVENAKLKTKIEEMGERECDMKILAEENEKLRRAHIKLNVELEKYKASNSMIPQCQNFAISHQIQELKEENKNKAKLIYQLGKQQENLTIENEKLKAKILKQKDLFNKLTLSSNHLIKENERLQALFQEQKKKSLQKKEEINALMLKMEQNEPTVNHQILQSLNEQVEKLEKSYNEIQRKNDRLLKENQQLKEQISLYQQIDLKMQTENQQLKSTISEMMNSKQMSMSADQNSFDKSQYVQKSAFDQLNSSFLELQHQFENLQNNSNDLKHQLSIKEMQYIKLVKEKEGMAEQLKESQNKIEEINFIKNKFENQYKLSKEEINQLNKTIVANEQISYENSQLREKNISLTKKLAEYSSSEKLELENNTLKQENTKLKEALDQASQISEIKDLVYGNGYGYENDNIDLTNENEELKNELVDARNRLTSIMNVLKKCSIENIIPEM